MYNVYILTNKNNTVVYIGVTNNIERRLYEHKNELIKGFTKKYHLHKLVYNEVYNDINDALRREKQLKGWKRERKNALIQASNPNWEDISSFPCHSERSEESHAIRTSGKDPSTSSG